MKRLIPLALLLTTPANASDGGEPETVRLAVRAHSGVDKAIRKWKPTADYLARATGRPFALVPHEGIDEMAEAVAQGSVDFVLTNPSSYVELEARFGVTRVATLINRRLGAGYTRFGGVFFTRAEREDIEDLRDLRGKSFMAVAEKAFGGWWMELRELRRNGLDTDDFSRLEFGFLQDKVVRAVLAGEVDAGCVRTDMLERLGAAGEIDLGQIKVIHQRRTEGFPLLHSTPLYPEWPFARARNTPDALAEEVLVALLEMPEDADAARAGHYVGWTVPLDYEPVHELMRTLLVGPYRDLGRITLAQVLERYWPWLVALLIAAVLVLAGIAEHLRRSNLRLVRAQTELRRSNEELESFAYVASHDLRTPMRAMFGYAEILLEDHGDSIDEEGRRLLERQQQIVVRMDELVAALLEYSRIGNVGLNLTEVDLDVVLRDVLDELAEAISTSETEVRVPRKLPRAVCDRVRVAQVFRNLVGNATKYNQSEKRWVEIGYNGEGTARTFYVRDNGIGIPPAHRERVFGIFKRLHGEGAFGGGVGAGLTIVKRIIERHGGSIRVESTPGEGSSFYFTLSGSEVDHGTA